MIGKQIGNYRIVEKLGEGGMGVVYKGVDVLLDRTVAVKVLGSDLAGNPELVERFRAEARAQANLNHPNLATLYTFLVENDSAMMVMEYVDGETFDQMIRQRGPIPSDEAVPLFKQALLGIGVAHRMGIIHRDIKPGNLMLRRDGIVKVMDFGIAKLMGAKGATRTGTQVGTVAYMSPEQIQNRAVDVRSDIYALGVTLYEMLSGHVPFESDSDFQIMDDHVRTPPPLLTRHCPYVPKGIENVVLKALEKSPGARFQTAEELGAALEHPEFVSAPSWATLPGTMRTTRLDGVETNAVKSGSAAGTLMPSVKLPASPVQTNASPPPSTVPSPAVSGKRTAIGVVVGAVLVLAGIGIYVLDPEPILIVVIGIAILAVVVFLVLGKPPAVPPARADEVAVHADVIPPRTQPFSGRSYGRLRVTSGRLSGKTLEITKEGVLIGRSPKCQLVLTDDTVSGEHAWIVPISEGVVVIDRGSSNGTYLNSLNSPRVSKVGLSDGDRIYIGKKGSTVITYFSS